MDGKSLLSTTDSSLSAEGVALGFDQLAEVEGSLRTPKSTLDLRPLNHRLPERIEALVLPCRLALLLVRLVEIETGCGWRERARDDLDRIHRVDLRTKGGTFQVVAKLSAEQRNLLTARKITPPRQVQAACVDAPAA